MNLLHSLQVSVINNSNGATYFFRDTESPSGCPWANAEVKDGTRKKLKQCKCKLSRCLK
ncbi:hypothetical protein MKW92_052722, partial [Papaver armeniacum]